MFVHTTWFCFAESTVSDWFNLVRGHLGLNRVNLCIVLLIVVVWCGRWGCQKTHYHFDLEGVPKKIKTLFSHPTSNRNNSGMACQNHLKFGDSDKPFSINQSIDRVSRLQCTRTADRPTVPQEVLVQCNRETPSKRMSSFCLPRLFIIITVTIVKTMFSHSI